MEQQLAPAREAVARTLNVGSTNLFKAVEGVRGRWAQRSNSTPTSEDSRAITPPVEVSKADVPRTARPADYKSKLANLRPFSLTSTLSLEPLSPNGPSSAPIATPVQQLSTWGSGLGSFLSAKALQFSALRTPTAPRPNDDLSKSVHQDGRLRKSAHEVYGEPEGSPLFNEMSPGASPTNVDDANLPSIASVMSSRPVSVEPSSSVGQAL